MAPHPHRLWTRRFAIGLLMACGLLLAFAGLLVPAHFRAIDAQVVADAGRGTTSVVDQGVTLFSAGRLGQARLFLVAAQSIGAPNTAGLQRVLASAAAWQSTNQAVSELDLILRHDPWALKWDGRPVMKLLAARHARDAVRAHLAKSVRTGTLEILETIALTNLNFFSPAHTASGQPYAAAVLLAGLLAQDDTIPPNLRDAVESLAYGATRKGQTEPLERFYLDLVSLGNRMNWGQLVDLLNQTSDLATLKALANLARYQSKEWPVLFASAQLLGSAQPVTSYLIGHAKSGLDDLKFSLNHGSGALHALIDSNARVHRFDTRDRLVQYDPFYTLFITQLRAARAWGPWALLLKYALVVAGAFLLSRAIVDLMPVADSIAVKRWFSPAHWSLLGALVLLAAAMIEPFLFYHSQTLVFPLQWKFPMVRGGITETIETTLKSMMDMLTLGALVFFLVVQAVIYVVCLLKLAEIRRQSAPSVVKLKLLENEENMFDLGLYCGLGGTVASLVLLAMDVIKPSLMAAYASTLFGIIFVAVLKICHLRPLRRKLILDSEQS